MKTKIEESFISFKSIKSKSYYPLEFDDEIQSSDIVILPYNEIDVLFPEVTTELYKFLKESDKIRTSISISDEEYKKVEKHFDWIELGLFLVTSVAFPIVTGLLSNFLYDKLKTLNKKDDEVAADIEIIVEETKTKKSKKITYKGPVKEMKDFLEKTSKDLFNDK